MWPMVTYILGIFSSDSNAIPLALAIALAAFLVYVLVRVVWVSTRPEPDQREE